MIKVGQNQGQMWGDLQFTLTQESGLGKGTVLFSSRRDVGSVLAFTVFTLDYDPSPGKQFPQLLI